MRLTLALGLKIVCASNRYIQIIRPSAREHTNDLCCVCVCVPFCLRFRIGVCGTRGKLSLQQDTYLLRARADDFSRWRAFANIAPSSR